MTSRRYKIDHNSSTRTSTNPKSTQLMPTSKLPRHMAGDVELCRETNRQQRRRRLNEELEKKRRWRKSELKNETGHSNNAEQALAMTAGRKINPFTPTVILSSPTAIYQAKQMEVPKSHVHQTPKNNRRSERKAPAI